MKNDALFKHPVCFSKGCDKNRDDERYKTCLTCRKDGRERKQIERNSELYRLREAVKYAHNKAYMLQSMTMPARCLYEVEKIYRECERVLNEME